MENTVKLLKVVLLLATFGLLAVGVMPLMAVTMPPTDTTQNQCCQWCPDHKNPGSFYCCNVCLTEGC